MLEAKNLHSSWNTMLTRFVTVVDSIEKGSVTEELYKMLAHENLRKAGLLIFANEQMLKNAQQQQKSPSF